MNQQKETTMRNCFGLGYQGVVSFSTVQTQKKNGLNKTPVFENICNSKDVMLKTY